MQIWTLLLGGAVIVAVPVIAIKVSKLLRHRKAVRRRLAEITNRYYDGKPLPRSTCCNSLISPLSWTQDGWVATCDSCGSWQYLGDDHENPPPGFLREGFGIRFYPGHRIFAAPSPRPAANGPTPSPARRRPNSSPACWLCDGELEHTADCPHGILIDIRAEKGQPPRYVAFEPDHGLIESDTPIHPLQAFDPDGPPSQLERAYDHREAARISRHFGDEGEPLKVPPMPNLGGEGNPEYRGPHYETPADYPTEAPFELHRDPPEGAAVRLVGEDDQ